MMPKLPRFNKPPVTEVLCCVYFQELLALNAPHLGDLWEAFGRDRYKRTQNVVPLPPVNVSLIALITMGLQNLQTEQFQLPRTLFISGDETLLIQVQRDRLIFNWRKSKDNDPYPSYDRVIAGFKEIFETFFKFAKDVGELKITGLELTYVNHLFYKKELPSIKEIGAVLPLFTWEQKGNPAFSDLAAINCNAQFNLPDDDGQFHMAINTAQRRQDGEAILRLDFLARKLAPEIHLDAIWPWFDRSHERIVTSFADVTDSGVQRTIWDRTQ